MPRNINPIIAIFAIIGGLVLLGIVVRVASALIGLAIVVGVVLVIFYFVQNAMRNR